VVPVLLHWPHLSGWLSENPIYVFSGISQGSSVGHGVLSGYPGWVDGNAGLTTQALGGLAAHDWLHWIVPWWNPYSGVGLPLAAELQNSAFFLPFVLLLGLFNGIVYLKIAMQIAAGLACCALLRELGLCRLATLIGAVCFELNGSFAWFAHGPIMPVAFLPLLLFGIERARRQRAQGALWVGVAIAWSLLAGFPETAYLDGLLGLGWAILRLGQAERRRGLMLAIGGGGLAGALVAAPLLLAFAESLPVSFLGGHVDFGATILPASSRAALVFPYLYGLPMYGGLRLTGAASLAQYIQWFRTAGYLDLGLLALAAMAWRRGAPERGLRAVLTLWVIVALGRAMGVPLLDSLVNLVPLVRHAMFDLYCVPSCQMALSVLAACVIDDWRRGRLPQSRVLMSGAGVALLGVAALVGAAPAMGSLGGIEGYWLYPFLSVFGGAVVLGLACWWLSGAFSLRRGWWLGVLLTGEAAVLFFLPLLGGTPRPRGIDRAALAVLADAPGINRISAVDSLAPNYGAWFGVAMIEHNYLPVAQNWVDDVRATLLPGNDGVNNFVPALDPPALAALRGRLGALAAHGVTELLLPAGADPFASSIILKTALLGNVARGLAAPVRFTVPAGQVVGGALDSVSVGIGTYAGAAGGRVHLRVCQAARCVQGAVGVRGAADNGDITIRLAAPLPMEAGQALVATLSWQAGGDGPPPAVWLWPSSEPGDPAHPFWVPRATLRLAPPPGAPVPIYADPIVSIFRLPDAAPYFAAAGCSVTVQSRRAGQADCRQPSRLLRRELCYPGWGVRLDGRAAAVACAGIYQSVQLPGGRSRFRFVYAPPGVAYAWAASAVGGLALAALGGWCVWGFWRGRSSGRRRMIGRST
jgi:hypothetical protein